MRSQVNDLDVVPTLRIRFIAFAPLDVYTRTLTGPIINKNIEKEKKTGPSLCVTRPGMERKRLEVPFSISFIHLFRART